MKNSNFKNAGNLNQDAALFKCRHTRLFAGGARRKVGEDRRREESGLKMDTNVVCVVMFGSAPSRLRRVRKLHHREGGKSAPTKVRAENQPLAQDEKKASICKEEWRGVLSPLLWLPSLPWAAFLVQIEIYIFIQVERYTYTYVYIRIGSTIQVPRPMAPELSLCFRRRVRPFHKNRQL